MKYCSIYSILLLAQTKPSKALRSQIRKDNIYTLDTGSRLCPAYTLGFAAIVKILAIKML